MVAANLLWMVTVLFVSESASVEGTTRFDSRSLQSSGPSVDSALTDPTGNTCAVFNNSQGTKGQWYTKFRVTMSLPTGSSNIRLIGYTMGCGGDIVPTVYIVPLASTEVDRWDGRFTRCRLTAADPEDGDPQVCTFDCDCPLGCAELQVMHMPNPQDNHGWKFCSITDSIAVGECQSGSPCSNGATCHDTPLLYTCACASGFTGFNCETDIDECDSNPCQNGGSCNGGTNGYACTCTAGWTSANCDQDINECDSNPCQNAGTCTDGANQYTCTCEAGYQGNECQTNINECNSSPCQNGGTCNDGMNGYTCTCAVGWQGIVCDQNINECSTNPCLNGGTCTDAIGTFTCACVSGYQGNTCETDINECSPNPCLRGGTCTDGVGTYTCTCVSGYQGNTCETDINECSSSPCQNGGTCNDGINGYTCTCAAGWQGPVCDQDINECSPNPCLHGGTCTDGIGNFTCACVSGYQGNTCETNINECSPDPCTNGGTCTDGVAQYTCTCATGFTGLTCQTVVSNPCDNSPCFNGGTCTNIHPNYACACTPGSTGTHCETVYLDCLDVYNGGSTTTGSYFIIIDTNIMENKIVKCDMTTDGGGWTVFSNVHDGSVSFNTNLQTYQNGFGSLSGEFWLGNHAVHKITHNGYDYVLRVDMKSFSNVVRYAIYDSFRLDTGAQNYKLYVDYLLEGDAGDSISIHSGQPFHASDFNPTNCYGSYQTGWWYRSCFDAKLTGTWGATAEWKGVVWRSWLGSLAFLKEASMKIKRLSKSCDSNPCPNGGICTNRVNGHSCECGGAWYGTGCATAASSWLDCQAVHTAGQVTSGVYALNYVGSSYKTAYCDMDTDGGGWTTMMRVVDGNMGFDRNWTEYRYGFGNTSGNYWLGNEIVHAITSTGNYKLRIDMTSYSSTSSYAVFSGFRLEDNTDRFRLRLSGYVGGTAGNGLINHKDRQFNTWDYDPTNCAIWWRVGWWYANCFNVKLNGMHGADLQNNYGIIYDTWNGYGTFAKTAEMKFKKV